MKDFLKKSFGTDQIDNVTLEQLKEKVDAPSLVTRLKYRKGIASGGGGKSKVSV